MNAMQAIQESVPQSPSLLDVTAAVAYFKSVGARTATVNFVRSLIAAGQLPHTKIGKAFYIQRADIDQWISRRAKRARG